MYESSSIIPSPEDYLVYMLGSSGYGNDSIIEFICAMSRSTAYHNSREKDESEKID